MRDFDKLLVWKNGIGIIAELFDALNEFSDDEKFGFWFQATRSAASIISNVAEGNLSGSTREHACHLQIALNAACELETYILNGQRECLDEVIIRNLLNMIAEEQKMLASFIDKLRT